VSELVTDASHCGCPVAVIATTAAALAVTTTLNLPYQLLLLLPADQQCNWRLSCVCTWLIWFRAVACTGPTHMDRHTCKFACYWLVLDLPVKFAQDDPHFGHSMFHSELNWWGSEALNMYVLPHMHEVQWHTHYSIVATAKASPCHQSQPRSLFQSTFEHCAQVLQQDSLAHRWKSTQLSLC
jgi:hypothetical protein